MLLPGSQCVSESREERDREGVEILCVRQQKLFSWAYFPVNQLLSKYIHALVCSAFVSYRLSPKIYQSQDKTQGNVKPKFWRRKCMVASL